MIYVLGGGENLNFKVVGGTSAPSNPKENTIWVNTSTAITSWDFSATEPAKRSKNKNMVLVDASTTTKNGVTFTVNSDGSITVNGTASAGSEMRIGSMPVTRLLEVGKTYTLKGTGDSNIGIGIHERTAADSWVKTHAQEYIKDVTFTYNGVSANGNEMYVYLYVPSGRKVSSVIVYPQLEKGSTATSFVKGDATGHVWISTGPSSIAPFNALKKNGIMVYPLSAKQYVNGAWVRKTAKTYQNGALVDWWNGELYDSGNEYTAVTGGWVAEGKRWDSSTGAGTPNLVKNPTSITLGRTGSPSPCIFYVKNKINLTDYETLNYNGTLSSEGIDNWYKVAVWSEFGTYINDNVVASTSLKGSGTATRSVDVSHLEGEYYIGAFVYAKPDLTMYKMWLE